MVARFVVVLAVAIALPALGQELDPRETQARQECLSGNPDKGVALLAALFAETENANFIYNQARCFEQNARFDDAGNRFREYLRVVKDISPADRADVQKHIAECQAMQAEKDKKAAAAVPPPAPPPAPTADTAPESAALAAPAASEPPPAGLDLTAQPATEPTPIYKKWWFWTGIGAVVAAGAVTSVLLLTRSSGACDAASHTCLGVK